MITYLEASIMKCVDLNVLVLAKAFHSNFNELQLQSYPIKIRSGWLA